MEVVVSLGKIWPWPLFVKALPLWQTIAGRGGAGAVRVCLVNICLRFGKDCCYNVVLSFAHHSTCHKAALSTSVLWVESSQGETKAQVRHLSVSWPAVPDWYGSTLGNCNKSISSGPRMLHHQTSSPPAQPFVNRHFDDNSQCRVVPNQYTQSGHLHTRR